MSEETVVHGSGASSVEADPSGPEKPVTWAELFFDLVFVVAITKMSTLVGYDHSWSGLLRALIVFVPVYWLWVGTSIQTNLADTSRASLHLRIFAVALAGVFMALAVSDVYGGEGMMFAAAYWAGRLVLGAAFVHRSGRRITVPLNGFSVAMVVTGPLLVVGALAHGDAREVLWAAAAVIDLATPSVLRSRLASLQFNAGHLTERFGLFVLIALGESVVSVGTLAPNGSLTAGQASSVAAAFVLACGLWWTYFHFAADAMRHSLATARVQVDITRLVLSYGHLSFIAAIIAVAVGLRESIAQPGQHLTWAVTGLLFGGTALYLATFGFTRWAMFRLVSYTRLTTAAVVLALLPVAPNVPALASLILLAGVLAALNIFELVRNNQSGWLARKHSGRA
ncbi:MAG: low temperature requirement protein A [Acidimicrobiales bacterium]